MLFCGKVIKESTEPELCLTSYRYSQKYVPKECISDLVGEVWWQQLPGGNVKGNSRPYCRVGCFLLFEVEPQQPRESIRTTKNNQVGRI